MLQRFGRGAASFGFSRTVILCGGSARRRRPNDDFAPRFLFVPTPSHVANSGHSKYAAMLFTRHFPAAMLLWDDPELCSARSFTRLPTSARSWLPLLHGCTRA
jgi:hypothetical protein